MEVAQRNGSNEESATVWFIVDIGETAKLTRECPDDEHAVVPAPIVFDRSDKQRLKRRIGEPTRGPQRELKALRPRCVSFGQLDNRQRVAREVAICAKVIQEVFVKDADDVQPIGRNLQIGVLQVNVAASTHLCVGIAKISPKLPKVSFQEQMKVTERPSMMATANGKPQFDVFEKPVPIGRRKGWLVNHVTQFVNAVMVMVTLREPLLVVEFEQKDEMPLQGSHHIVDELKVVAKAVPHRRLEVHYADLCLLEMKRKANLRFRMGSVVQVMRDADSPSLRTNRGKIGLVVMFG
jgi:hypothetical protein